MRFGAGDLAPILGIVVVARHNNADFFLPIWAQFQNAPVDFYGNGAAVSDDHRFSRQEVHAILFVMFNNIPAEGINRGSSAQHAFHLAQHFLALFDGCSVCLFLQQRIGFVNFLKRLLIQFEMNDAAFIVNRARCTVLHRLRHIVYVDIIAKNLARVAVFHGNWRSGKANKRRIRQCVADDPRVPHNDAPFLLSLLVFPKHNPLF